MNEQKHYFNVANLTKSLTVSSAWYTEGEPTVPSSVPLSVRAKIQPGVHRYYSFTVTNSSSKIIDEIALVFRLNDVIAERSFKYYKYSRDGLKPQESVILESRAKRPDLTVAIEAIIFRDGTYEGDLKIAEIQLARGQAIDAKMVELMTLFKERGLLFPQTVMVIGSNAKEMRALAKGEFERHKGRKEFQDTRDSDRNRAALDGIVMIDAALSHVEQHPSQQAMRDFIAKIANLTGVKSFEE